ncbi:trypsin-like peptidase domain-containing protein [Nocardioides rotundus]|uniref:S1C family serine protease n=1 Tax=Nocardioides rotundus TaxID=1774216 RepID=UPI001CBAC37C|nr:trypsin-like peptidase domain-containing protein [Nocardioides rotundus]UAL30744.1 trypsin-like peptidase domain-containing protein [Nocardioides rotundus]
MSDQYRPGHDHPSGPDDTEPTEPIRPVSGSPDAEPTRPVPPAEQAPQPYWPTPDPQTSRPEPAPTGPPVSPPPGPGYGPPEYAGRHYGSPEPRGRVSGWIWPTMAALALVIGLLGGIAGSALWGRLTDDSPVGGSSGGLEGVDTSTTPPLPADNGSIAAVADKLLPSTVQISAEADGQPGGATGSGFVLDRQGHVVTNNHVVAGAADAGGKIEIVDQNGERHTARLVGRSPVYDLAVLYVPDAKDLTPASLGRSESLRIGEGVVAIGSPLGLSSTVTSGIVSALDRPVTTGGAEADDLSYINAVQTDAAINPGNSGGPLVNLRGQVVGVNSAIATAGGGFGGEAGNIGVGFAIPVEQVRVTADQILKDGEARYPVIGAQVNTGRADQEGAPVVEVMSGTPAEKAGLREGDLITAVDGERVTDGIALIVSIRTHQPGETIEFTVERNGRERTVPVTLDSEVG